MRFLPASAPAPAAATADATTPPSAACAPLGHARRPCPAPAPQEASWPPAVPSGAPAAAAVTTAPAAGCGVALAQHTAEAEPPPPLGLQVPRLTPQRQQQQPTPQQQQQLTADTWRRELRPRLLDPPAGRRRPGPVQRAAVEAEVRAAALPTADRDRLLEAVTSAQNLLGAVVNAADDVLRGPYAHMFSMDGMRVRILGVLSEVESLAASLLGEDHAYALRCALLDEHGLYDL